ncbi:MAG TPA: PAS domain S-box protein [Streptosporangiaceae bacterium]|nr:PAS domain S-box protein [Streptosporangiaceae bacterium]
MDKEPCPAQWTGKQAVVTLPDHVGASNSGQIREQLVGLVNDGAAVLVADMTATVSCDPRGADALLHAYQRASGNGTQLRVAVTGPGVRRALDAAGLDRLISIYPSVEAAVGTVAPAGVLPLASRPARQHDTDQASSRRPARRWAAGPRDGALAAGITPAVVWGLVDNLADGVVLTSDDGVLVLANRRAEELFGYAHSKLAGRRVESLIPARLRAAHVSYRAGYAKEPVARPMGARARLAGLRTDGTTFPVRVSLSPVPTATGRLIMAVIRDITGEQPRADLAELARVAATADQARRGEDLLDRVVTGLFDVGLSLQAAADLPHDAATQHIAVALGRLDDTIREIRDHVFTGQHRQGRPDPAPRNGSG